MYKKILASMLVLACLANIFMLDFGNLKNIKALTKDESSFKDGKDNLEKEDVNSANLVMNDDTNKIIGLNSNFVYSTNQSSQFKRGKTDDLFSGTKTIEVYKYSENLLKSTIWREQDYKGDKIVRHNGTMYKAQYFANANQVPGVHDVWLVIQSTPPIVNTFNFTSYTGQTAIDFQNNAAQKVEKTKKVIGYFADWQGYKKDYEPENEDFSYFTDNMDGKGYDPIDVPFDKITHINYGFLLVHPETGELYFNDEYAPYDLGEGPTKKGGKNYIGQINEMADANNVTSMISIGGWTNSQEGGFDFATSTPDNMDKFTTDLVNFMALYNFDGIDIDWEYPDSEVKQARFLTLIKQLREKLTTQGHYDDKYYQLSAALPASYKIIEFVSPEELVPYLDTFNIMTYDYRGGFDDVTGHQTPLYPIPSDLDQKLNVSSSMKEYHEKYNVPKNKLMLGLGYYSRGWSNVESAELGVFGGDSPIGSTWDDKEETSGLKPHWQINLINNPGPFYEKDVIQLWDDVAKVPYMYIPSKKEFYTYDDARSITEKVDYTIDNGYGGVIIWELSYDTQDTTELTTIAKRVKTEIKYNLDFDLNGGTSVQPKLQTILVGEKAVEPEIPTKEGHIFKNWTIALDGSVWDFQTSTMPNNNITLVANWGKVVNQYTVEFNLNGSGGTPPPTQTVNMGGFASSPNTPTYAGYTFEGWYTNASGTSSKWYFDSKYVNSNIVLYAKWSRPAIKYTANFDLNGAFGNGVVRPRTQIILAGGVAVEPPIPTSNGRKFEAWYTTSYLYGEKWDFSKPINDHLVLYARWTVIVNYNATFDLNGADGTPPPMQKVSSTELIVEPKKPTYEGHKFIGWTRYPYSLSSLWNFSGDKMYEHTKLYAKWVKN